MDDWHRMTFLNEFPHPPYFIVELILSSPFYFSAHLFRLLDSSTISDGIISHADRNKAIQFEDDTGHPVFLHYTFAMHERIQSIFQLAQKYILQFRPIMHTLLWESGYNAHIQKAKNAYESFSKYISLYDKEHASFPCLQPTMPIAWHFCIALDKSHGLEIESNPSISINTMTITPIIFIVAGIKNKKEWWDDYQRDTSHQQYHPSSSIFAMVDKLMNTQ